MPVKKVDMREAYREAYRLARLAAGERYRASKRRTADEHRFINIFGKPYYLLMPLTSLHADNRTAKLWGWINDGRHLEWFNSDGWQRNKLKRTLEEPCAVCGHHTLTADQPANGFLCLDCGAAYRHEEAMTF